MLFWLLILRRSQHCRVENVFISNGLVEGFSHNKRFSCSLGCFETQTLLYWKFMVWWKVLVTTSGFRVAWDVL